jgi:hypothetical protein
MILYATRYNFSYLCKPNDYLASPGVLVQAMYKLCHEISGQLELYSYALPSFFQLSWEVRTFVTAGCTIAKRDQLDLRVITATVFSSYFKAKYFVLFNLKCFCSSSLYCYKELGTWIVSLRSWLSRPWVWAILCKMWNSLIVSLNL